MQIHSRVTCGHWVCLQYTIDSIRKPKKIISFKMTKSTVERTWLDEATIYTADKD